MKTTMRRSTYKVLMTVLFAAFFAAAFFYFAKPVMASDGATVTAGSAVIVPEKDNSDKRGQEMNSDDRTSDQSSDEESNDSENDGTGSLTPSGNMTLVDDADEKSGLEFVTLTTKDGHYFYLVIDRTSNIENVYFLNAVDEADLLSLMSTDEVAAYEEAKENAIDKESDGKHHSSNSASVTDSADSTSDTILDEDEITRDGIDASEDGDINTSDEQTKKKVDPIAIAMRAAFFLIAVGGALGGIYLYKKKKTEKEDIEFQDDEEVMLFPEEKDE